MPRIQPLMPLLRPFAAPRTVTCRQHFRFSTASRLCAEAPSHTTAKPSRPTTPSQAPPAAPTTPQEAARAADLAAAEAITESDSAQPPEPKPELPSKRASKPAAPKQADNVFPPASPTSHPNTESALKSAPTTSRTTPRTTTTPKSTPSPISVSLPPPKYHVSRTANKNLPIYTDYKRGGNLHLTTVRRITGNSIALRDELRAYLNKKDEDVKINGLTGHVVVKGHCVETVKGFLEQRGM